MVSGSTCPSGRRPRSAPQCQERRSRRIDERRRVPNQRDPEDEDAVGNAPLLSSWIPRSWMIPYLKSDTFDLLTASLSAPSDDYHTHAGRTDNPDGNSAAVKWTRCSPE